MRFLYVALCLVVTLFSCSTNTEKEKNNTSEPKINQISDSENKSKVDAPVSSFDEKINEGINDPEAISKGGKTYALYCGNCHGQKGEGSIASNLTDEYWLYGGKEKEILNSIIVGIPNKGMPGWKDQLTPQQIGQLFRFVKSLQGTNPPNAKESQGVKED